jgi:hypothetical protein
MPCKILGWYGCRQRPSYPANRGQGRAMARSYAAARSSSAGAGARSRLGSHGAEA